MAAKKKAATAKHAKTLKRYGVNLPFTGVLYIEVEAESEAAALSAAFERANLNEEDDVQLVEWQAHEHVAEGNVSNAVCNDYSVEELP